MNSSNNAYDWLGPGMYFWECNHDRAQEWAEEHFRKKKKEPAVIGCIIDLGYCMDFLETKYLSLLKPAHERYKQTAEVAGFPLVENENSGNSFDFDLRSLDCAVIRTIHTDREDQKLPRFDTVRGVFWEGEEPYLHAGFKQKNHIQVCVRNPNCLKGFFLPREKDIEWLMP